jgi:enoyl-CoA hydratase
MGYDDLTYLDVSVAHGVAEVRLSNPAHANAYDLAGHAELAAIMRRLQGDDDVRSVLVSGAGDAFSAGPLPEPGVPKVGPGAPVAKTLDEVRQIVYGALECDKPVACAINGVVRGSALTFALVCDVVIIERHISFADVHVLAALTAGDGGALTWPLAMGLLKAKRYLLTGDPLPAVDAERLGLVTEVVETGDSVARAREYAERWAAGPPAALRTTKRTLNQWLRLGALTVLDTGLALQEGTMQSTEAAAAVERFMQEGRGAVPPDPRA